MNDKLYIKYYIDLDKYFLDRYIVCGHAKNRINERYNFDCKDLSFFGQYDGYKRLFITILQYGYDIHEFLEGDLKNYLLYKLESKPKHYKLKVFENWIYLYVNNKKTSKKTLITLYPIPLKYNVEESINPSIKISKRVSCNDILNIKNKGDYLYIKKMREENKIINDMYIIACPYCGAFSLSFENKDRLCDSCVEEIDYDIQRNLNEGVLLNG